MIFLFYKLIIPNFIANFITISLNVTNFISRIRLISASKLIFATITNFDLSFLKFYRLDILQDFQH